MAPFAGAPGPGADRAKGCFLSPSAGPTGAPKPAATGAPGPHIRAAQTHREPQEFAPSAAIGRVCSVCGTFLNFPARVHGGDAARQIAELNLRKPCLCDEFGEGSL